MQMLGRIRRMRMRDRLGYSEIARRTGLSRNTVKRWLKDSEAGVGADGTAGKKSVVAPKYKRPAIPGKLAPYVEQVQSALIADSGRIKRERRTARKLFEQICAAGYDGGYSRLTDFIRTWRAAQGRTDIARHGFVPLHFALGEAFQFDWSEEGMMIGGVHYRMQVAHMKLCASRAFFVVAYPSQGHEMLFDAHTRSFAAFGGVPRRGIYDNMKTAVDRVGRGKARTVNARFAAMCAHYLFDPEFCNVASGWEKGVVEKNVQDARRRIWLDAKNTRFSDFTALNVWLAARCKALWEEVKHPQHKQCTVAEMIEHEQAQLMPMPVAFDGYVETLARVSSTALVSVDGNRYSVPCEWVRQMVSARVYHERIEVVHMEIALPMTAATAVAILPTAAALALGPSPLASSISPTLVPARISHPRAPNKGRVLYDWQHYIPLIQRKPGALRNGAPFTELPAPLQQLRRALLRRDGGDRIMAQVLGCVPKAGLEAVLVAVELMLERTGTGAVSAEHVMNVLSRLNDVPPLSLPLASLIPANPALQLKEPPRADVNRYDSLRTELVASEVFATPWTQGADHA
jgi:transposase